MKNSKHRKNVLERLVRFDSDLDLTQLEEELLSFDWDWLEKELAVVSKENLLNILSRYQKSQISASNLQKWAELLELREDIDYETKEVKEIVHELADISVKKGIPEKVFDEYFKILKKQLIKVDRVSSVPEAQELEKLGVDIIGIDIGFWGVFDDKRALSLVEAEQILDKLNVSKKCLMISFDQLRNQKIIHLIKNKADFCQVAAPTANSSLINDLNSLNNTNIIYGNIQADHDDDSSWVESRFSEVNTQLKNKVFFQLELLPDIENAWTYLVNEAGKYDCDLNFNDVLKLVSKYPTLVSTQFSKENIREITQKLSKCFGLAFVLGNVKRDCSSIVRGYDYPTVTSFISEIKKI